jgi:predicted metal-dependent peptidase
VVARDTAIAAAAEPGSVPAGLARWADSLLRPRVDWRRELATAIRRGAAQVSGRVDYSYGRRSRRAAVMPGLVLPGLIRPVPEVAVVCDTSGSMGSTELGACLTEIEGIIAGIGARSRRVAVLAVDCEVQATARVNRAGQVSLRGGGGTDMGEGIAAAVALRPRPQVIVVLTDGCTPWPPGPPPATTVIVGLIGRGQAEGPRWAHTVRIGEPA